MSDSGPPETTIAEGVAAKVLKTNGYQGVSPEEVIVAMENIPSFLEEMADNMVEDGEAGLDYKAAAYAAAEILRFSLRRGK